MHCALRRCYCKHLPWTCNTCTYPFSRIIHKLSMYQCIYNVGLANIHLINIQNKQFLNYIQINNNQKTTNIVAQFSWISLHP